MVWDYALLPHEQPIVSLEWRDASPDSSSCKKNAALLSLSQDNVARYLYIELVNSVCVDFGVKQTLVMGFIRLL